MLIMLQSPDNEAYLGKEAKFTFVCSRGHPDVEVVSSIRDVPMTIPCEDCGNGNRRSYGRAEPLPRKVVVVWSPVPTNEQMASIVSALLGND